MFSAFLSVYYYCNCDSSTKAEGSSRRRVREYSIIIPPCTSRYWFSLACFLRTSTSNRTDLFYDFSSTAINYRGNLSMPRVRRMRQNTFTEKIGNEPCSCAFVMWWLLRCVYRERRTKERYENKARRTKKMYPRNSSADYYCVTSVLINSEFRIRNRRETCWYITCTAHTGCRR